MIILPLIALILLIWLLAAIGGACDRYNARIWAKIDEKERQIEIYKENFYKDIDQ